MLHRDALDSPPTKDQAMGLWMEANYLAESGFDYAALMQQPGELLGGPKLYVISALPTFLAILMTLAPSPQHALIAYHGFTLACAAVVLTVVFELVWPATGWVVAALVCVALATTPAFSVQTEMCGMDMPLAAAAAVAGWFTIRGRLLRGTALSLVAFFVKSSGIVVTAATLGVAVVVMIAPQWGSGRITRRRAALAVAASGAVLVLEFLLMFQDWAGLRRF